MSLTERGQILLSDLDDVRGKATPLLRALRGHTLRWVELAWDSETDEWCSDAPVVLRTDAGDLSLDALRSEEFELGWRVHDTASLPLDGTVPELRWRRSPMAGLRVLEGLRIEDMLVRIRDDGSRPEGTLFGFDVALDGGYLRVFNALDENGLAFDAQLGVGERLIPLAG